MKNIFLLICILFICKSTYAAHSISEADIERISKSDTWLKLLVYDGEESFITSREFFFATDGNKNPTSELIATLNAFSNSNTLQDIDDHPQCKFPGRYAWLKTQINLQSMSIEEQICPSFNSFSKDQHIDSVSLIFATGFLGNPASYYGHLLVKLNTTDSKINDLQNTAINFGADVPINENMALYILKGITGGYDSSFTQQQYFLHAGNYGESELRDLWEYELDLEPKDIEILLGHIWELLGADYNYYFFNRNCAFHMGQLFQLVIQEKLTDSSRLWVTPQAIMQNLANSTYKEKSLIKSIKYHPSRQSRLYQRFTMLTQKQKLVLSNLVNSPDTINLLSLEQFSLEQQLQVIDTLIDYFQFLRKADKGESDLNNKYYKQALMLRYKLPPGASSASFVSEQRPHLGRKPSLSSIQFIKSNRSVNFGKLQLRPAYYDALDAQEGHVAYSSLSMAEINLGFTPYKVFLKDLSLLKIESIRANLTGLPGDQNYSWYIDVGATQAYLGCADCSATKISSGIGYAFQSRIDFNISGFVGAGYMGRNISSENAYISTRLMSTWYINDKIAINLDKEFRHFQTSEKTHLIKLTTRYAWDTNTEMRFSLANDSVATEIGVSLGWYW